MTTLLIKTKDNKIYTAKVPLHFMVAEQHGVNLDNVVAVGFLTKGREIWDNRKPH